MSRDVVTAWTGTLRIDESDRLFERAASSAGSPVRLEHDVHARLGELPVGHEGLDPGRLARAADLARRATMPMIVNHGPSGLKRMRRADRFLAGEELLRHRRR